MNNKENSEDVKFEYSVFFKIPNLTSLNPTEFLHRATLHAYAAKILS